MSSLQRIIEYLWPELILQGTPWFDSWAVEHRRQFANRCKIFFLLVTLGYIGHYFLVDIPNKKEPLHLWFAFRMTIASLAVVTVLTCFSTRLVNSRFVKLPAVCVAAIACVSQAYVPVYFPAAPWFYPYLFVFISALVLSTSPAKSLLFAVPVMFAFFDPLQRAGIPLYQLASASVVCAIGVFGVRGAYISEIRNYLLTQERDAYRDEAIELSKEYESRLKSFIPKVIADRLEHLISHTKLSVLEATLEVLTPRKKNVACLWSDIRGFTQGSNNIDQFLADSVVPEVKVCSDAIERHEGIPRKIGDLLFAYFDSTDARRNLIRSLLAGFELSELNKDMNATVSTVQVKRYILVSVGEALVGNVGGLNSGVEITALGPPVNFLARLDDATKEPGLARHLEPGDVILSSTAAQILSGLEAGVDFLRVCLKQEHVTIRDFPEVDEVFVLRPSQARHERLRKAYGLAI